MKLLTTTLALLLTAASVNAQNTYRNPVLNIDFADPSVQRATDGTFYAYATGCVVAKSSDLVHWTNVSNVFSRPTWNDSTYVKDGQTKTDYYSLWASDVNYVNGKYIMYYASALWGNGSRTGIGVATGNSPTKFTDVGRLFRSTEIKVENSIDPCYIEEGDKKYLAWGSFNGIYITELTDDGLAVKDPKNLTRIAGTAFEGAMIHKRGNYYYLFASTGSCCEGLNSTYETVVGRSKNILGPYASKDGQLMTNNARTVIITKNSNWVGPGHNSEIITDDAGQDWIMYHAYSRETPEIGRVLMLDRLKWDASGWPYVEGKAPSSGDQEGPIFYGSNGRNTTYRLQGTDFARTDFQGWTATGEGNTALESGVGTVFNPVMHVKDGSFSVTQSQTGLSDGFYEMRLQCISTQGNAQLVVGSVVSPVAITDGVVPTNAEDVSKAFQNKKHTQSAYGLVVSGKLTVGLLSNGLASGEELWASNVELIRRDGDETALQTCQKWYEARTELALQDANASSYYLGKLQGYKQDLEKATDYTSRQKALVNIHKTLSSLKALDPGYNPTGISDVKDFTPNNEVTYDTLGRIAAKNQKGIVIKKGKKLVVK